MLGVTSWDSLTTQLDPSSALVLATGAGALVAVVVDVIWLRARHVVTIVHEGGHAVAALLTGRRLTGIKLHSNTSGLTLSVGRPRGPGMVITASAGYISPSLVGLLGVVLLAFDQVTVMLWAGTALLVAHADHGQEPVRRPGPGRHRRRRGLRVAVHRARGPGGVRLRHDLVPAGRGPFGRSTSCGGSAAASRAPTPTPTPWPASPGSGRRAGSGCSASASSPPSAAAPTCCSPERRRWRAGVPALAVSRRRCTRSRPRRWPAPASRRGSRR